MLPCTEFAIFPNSDAYRADITVLHPGLDALQKVEGFAGYASHSKAEFLDTQLILIF